MGRFWDLQKRPLGTRGALPDPKTDPPERLLPGERAPGHGRSFKITNSTPRGSILRKKKLLRQRPRGATFQAPRWPPGPGNASKVTLALLNSHFSLRLARKPRKIRHFRSRFCLSAQFCTPPKAIPSDPCRGSASARPIRGTPHEDRGPRGPSERPLSRILAFLSLERHFASPLSRILAFLELEKAFFATPLEDSGLPLEGEKDRRASRCHFERPLSRILAVGSEIGNHFSSPSS